ncbi:MAG: acyltransferase [Bacteroidaceae bacterium]|nr:acyltransferase [Bacteroidaceae bacterium]
MQVPSRFDPIRPIEPEEIGQALASLAADPLFLAALASLPATGAPALTPEAIRAAIPAVRTNLDFQKTFIYPLVEQLAARLTTGLTIDADAIADKAQPHTFISNHRDIVLDSALLAFLLIGAGFPDTVEIAIGDNLLAYPWIETLVRLNKAFIVRRGLSLRETLAASRLLGEYMHFAVTAKRQNIWIAQREGRAKDSNDRTQEALLKMMCMGGEGAPADRIAALGLTPLSISYEYDPCDYLKAKEFQQKRDNPAHKKSRQDDLDNMRTGIFGYKGQVYYHIAAPLDAWLASHRDLPKADFFPALARHIDREIHRNYRIYATNRIALDLLDGTHLGGYTDAERAAFEKYVQSRVALVDLPNADAPFLTERILTMYANPLRNQLAAQ